VLRSTARHTLYYAGYAYISGVYTNTIQGKNNEMVKGKRVFSYVEKRAEAFGNGAHVVLPKEYAGKIVRVEEIK